MFSKETKKTLWVETYKIILTLVFAVIICGSALAYFNENPLNRSYSTSTSNSWSLDERYEITVQKEEYASFNIEIEWTNGTVEDYGIFKLFLGSPMKVSYGGDWEDAVTVNYYSPMDTVKTEGNVKLIVKPKRARVRGDPTFYRGEDYRNDTFLEQIHVVTDAVFFDEELGEVTYNFEISLSGNSIPIDMDVKEIKAISESFIRKADIP